MARRAKPESGGLVKVERQQDILDLFRDAGPKGLTKARIAKALDLSERTVARAIQLLEEQGAKFTETRGNAGYKTWIMEHGPRWDERVSPEARMALQVALLALAGGGTETWTRHLKSLQDLLDERLSHADRQAFQRLQARLAIHGAGEDPVPIDESVMRELLKALSSEPVLGLELTYHAASTGRLETREVVPHSLSHDLFGGSASLLCWDVKKDAIRQFRLVRIDKAAALGPRGFAPEEMKRLQRAQTYQIGGWVSDAEPQSIEVAIRDPFWAKSLQEDLPALPGCEVQALKGQTGILVRFLACEWHAPTRWVLQFGSAAEVLGPAEFRDHVAARLKEALARY